MATGAGWLAQKTGDAEAAEFYTTQLGGGFLAAMDKSGAGRLAAECDALASEGTLSRQMTDGLQEAGFHPALRNTLTAIGTQPDAA